MTTIMIPESLTSAFAVSAATTVCDEVGKILGYDTPQREATEADYEWTLKSETVDEIERSFASGPGRPFREIIDELQRRMHP